MATRIASFSFSFALKAFVSYLIALHVILVLLIVVWCVHPFCSAGAHVEGLSLPLPIMPLEETEIQIQDYLQDVVA